MSYHEEDFANMLFAWPAVEGRIIHLYELDPTHVAAQPTAPHTSGASQTMQVFRSTLPSCVFTDIAASTVLLELDPTHVHAH